MVLAYWVGMPKLIMSKEAAQDSYHFLKPVDLFTRPILAFEDSLTIQFNGENIHLYALPPGHYDDEIYIHFEETDILCIGSRVIPSGYPYADLSRGCTIEELVGRVKIFAESYPNTIIAPAHRNDLNAEQLLLYHQALTENIAVLDEGFQAGKTVDELVADSVLAPWDSLADYGVSHELWINLIARAKGYVDPPKESVCKAYD